MVAPDYAGACIANVVPALVEPGRPAPWLPDCVRDARQVVLLVLDGLGWTQLQARPAVAPCLTSMEGGAITSVAPTTTSAALASIVFGAPPAAHGVLGYRVRVVLGDPDEGDGDDDGDGGEVLNVLTWRTGLGDARRSVPPLSFSPEQAFGGRPVPVVSRAEFAGTGFTTAVFEPAPLVGWYAASSIALDVSAQLATGAELVYAYYDGVDKVAHPHGFGPYYDAELAAADRLVASIAEVLPRGAALVVTSDHGQIAVGDSYVELDGDLLQDVALATGESRFRWLHAKPGADVGALAEACRSRYQASGDAWVLTIDEIEDAGWLGGRLSPAHRRRVGDVALIARTPVAFVSEGDGDRRQLRCRHGSLTADEMYVPLVGVRAGGP